MEGRWLHDQTILDDYILFWFREGEGVGGGELHQESDSNT